MTVISISGNTFSVSTSLKLKLESSLTDLEDKLSVLDLYIKKNQFQKNIEDLKTKSMVEDFWSDNLKAAKILEELAQKQKFVSEVQEYRNIHEMLTILINEGEELEEVEVEIDELTNNIEKIYLQTLFSEEQDDFGCFITITAGSGGLEAQDWTSMLFSMYDNFLKSHPSYKYEIAEYSDKEVGIKSGVLKVTGPARTFPYGRLKGENGVHRLVRPSPFNANNNRHTSFASVIVSPIIDDSIKIEILESDLRIDTYRSSGAGGQHVNKTDSAVRITHLPTGVAVQCQNDRSQHRNKAEALSMLKSRLYALAEEKKKLGNQVQKDSISWGNQIRSYILDDSRIKDLRTGTESTQPDKVLAGDIDKFLDAFIKWSKSGVRG